MPFKPPPNRVEPSSTHQIAYEGARRALLNPSLQRSAWHRSPLAPIDEAWDAER